MISFAPDSQAIVSALYPFTATNAAADLRIGILTIREKWELYGRTNNQSIESIPGNWIPTKALTSLSSPWHIDALKAGHHYRVLEHPWQLMEWNDWAIREDFALITQGRYSEPIPETVSVSGVTNIFIEPGAQLEHCIINAQHGPVYIGSGATIMEGSCLRGPISIGAQAVVKMGTRIYGATTIGPQCVAGGEIKNSIMMGYSNKAHDGYMGDAVIGHWCNWGAGTSNSNIKNSAEPVQVWEQSSGALRSQGQKCGLLMGDFSRSSINTSFNTGTVVGVGANVFGSGLTPRYIPDFSWGMDGNTRYEWEKALRDMNNWKKLKGQLLSESEIQYLKAIFDRL